jgi:hypothetical protein
VNNYGETNPPGWLDWFQALDPKSRRVFLDMIEERIAASERTLTEQIARSIYGPTTNQAGAEMWKPSVRRWWQRIPVLWLLAREWVAKKILRVDLLSDHECPL